MKNDTENRTIPGEEFKNKMFDKVEFVGRALQEQAPLIEKCARLKEPILILGPSGVGKEVVARVIHEMSDRREKRFIAVNCGGLNEETLLSELFGHKKGAFTGADKEKNGAIAEANGSTLFLDEIGDMPIKAQTAVLRFLNDGKFQKLGAIGEDIKADVRVIAATNKNLKTEIKEGRFREDLFYRINVFPVTIPPVAPLDDRRTKTALQSLIPKIAKELGYKNQFTISREAFEGLRDYSYPGNYREMRNILKFAIVKSNGGEIAANDLPRYMMNTGGNGSGDDLLSLQPKDFKTKINDLIYRKLSKEAKEQGSISGAAKVFEMHDGKYRRRLNAAMTGEIF